MKLQQIEYLNEIFNITFTLQQTLYLIQIAKTKNHQKSILNSDSFYFKMTITAKKRFEPAWKYTKLQGKSYLTKFSTNREINWKKIATQIQKKKKITEKQIFFYFTANNRNIWTIGNPRGG